MDLVSKKYHVAIRGNDTWSGSESRPFRTIQRAAVIAKAGDTVIVHGGIYREHVNPISGGSSEENRITYEAAPGEQVIISGAEVISDWEHVSDSVYKTVIQNSFFGSFNPYKEVIWGDWFFTLDRQFHLGEVYINGKSLFEAASLKEVFSPEMCAKAREPEWSVHTWFGETDEANTTIYVNFGDINPTENVIEINVRKFCFWPEQTGINYITVRGFHLTMAAPNWAPPTALQEGLIGPHWSKGWIIENNVISNSKNSGISLGKEISTGHNEFSLHGRKQGTQHERDVVFNALRIGWNKDNIGSHIVRGNIIHDCEQTGICGHLGAIFSQIYNNHIYKIHHKRQYNGAEVAGIKLHAPIDCQIRNNHIHNCDRGLWMDWQTQGTRISGNLLYDNDTEDLFVEVSHGPYIIDNNIFLSAMNFHDMSQGGAIINNLFAGFLTWARVPKRFTHYHYAHETNVHGMMTILGGDNRYYNNIFLGTQPDLQAKEDKINPADWMFAEVIKQPDGSIIKGLAIYDDCPAEHDNWNNNLRSVDDFANVRLPIRCGSNIYFNDAKPFRAEANSKVFPDIRPLVKLLEETDGIYIELNNIASVSEVEAVLATTDFLGIAFESELPYENPDGSPLCIDNDFFGHPRPAGPITVGPIEGIAGEPSPIKWPIRLTGPVIS